MQILRAASVENSSIYKTYSLTVNSQQMTTITSLTIDGLSTATVTAAAGSVSAFRTVQNLSLPDGTVGLFGNLTYSDSSTDNASFVIYNDSTNAVIDTSLMDVSGNPLGGLQISLFTGFSAGLYRIVGSVNGGDTYTFYLQIIEQINTTDLTEITAQLPIYYADQYNTRIIYVPSGSTSLQLGVATVPANATNQTFDWAFYGAGTHPDATISNTGLLEFANTNFSRDLDPYVVQNSQFIKRIFVSKNTAPITKPTANTWTKSAITEDLNTYGLINAAASEGWNTNYAYTNEKYSNKAYFRFKVPTATRVAVGFGSAANPNADALYIKNLKGFSIYANGYVESIFENAVGAAINVNSYTSSTVFEGIWDATLGTIRLFVDGTLKATYNSSATSSDEFNLYVTYGSTTGAISDITFANNLPTGGDYTGGGGWGGGGGGGGNTVSITDASGGIGYSSKTVGVNGIGKTAYIAGQGEGTWAMDINVTRSDMANTDPLTITATYNGVTDSGFSYYAGGTNSYFLQGTETNYGLTILNIGVSGSTANPFIMYVYNPNPSAVAVTGISSISITGGSAPYYPTTTGLYASATVTPANATNTRVTYRIDITSVATIDSQTGAITPVSAGTARIIAMTEDGAYSSTIENFTISPTPTTVSVTNVTSSASTTTVTVGGQSKTAFVATAGEGWEVPITAVTRSDATNTDNIVFTTTNNGTTYGPYILGSTLYGGGEGVTTVSVSVDGSTADPYVFYVYFASTVSVTGISSTSLSGGSAPFYTTTTGLSVSASVTPNNATNQTVVYDSSNSAVATVNSSTGAITIVGVGSTRLTSTSSDGSYTSYYDLTVSPIAVTSIVSGNATPPYNSGNAKIGTTYQYYPAVQPSNATNKSITYSSSNTAVATINASGLLTPLTAGTTIITITSVSNSSVTFTEEITVIQPVTGISAVSYTGSTPFYVGGTASVSATISPGNATNKSVAYYTASAAEDLIISLNETTGAITALKPGTVTITALSTENVFIRSTYSLTVTALPANSVTSMTDIVLESTDPMHPSQWNNASVTLGPNNATNKDVTWTSTNSSIVRVWDDDGVTQDVVLVARGVGEATLRATSVSNSSIYKEITIKVYARTTSMNAISFIGSSPFRVGDSARVTSGVLPATAYQSIEWSSSDTSIATVDANGNLAAVSEGQCVIYATSVGIPVRIAKYTLTVAAAPTRVTGISPIEYIGTAPFRVNQSGSRVSATVEPANATNTGITYSSDNTSIANVNASSGILYGYGVGRCTITATTSDGGYTITYPLTVEAAYINVASITNLVLTAPSPIYGNSTGLSVTATALSASGGSPTNGTLLYYTKTIAICSVDKTTGEITLKNTAGIALVYAVSADNPNIRSNDLSITVLAPFTALTGISQITSSTQTVSIIDGQRTLYIRNGGTLQLVATPVPANATSNTITWSSSSTGITVSAGGLATMVTNDTDATITATNANGTSKTIALKHVVDVAGVNMISLTPDSPLELNTTAVATSGTYPADATYPGITWSAVPSGIVTINQSGNVTAIAPGSTTIYARAIDNSGIVESYPITVSVPFVEIDGISQITYTGPEYLHVNETGARISAYVTPTNATNKEVSYTWSPINRLSIDACGNITALASGPATIYASATASDGITVYDSEYVLMIYPETVNITDIGCLEPNMIVDIGSSFTFRNPMIPEYATNNQVTWISADPDIASVNENGTVTGLTRGKTTITATSVINTSLSASYTLTVSSVPVSDITPIGTSTTVFTLVATNTMQMVAQVIPSNAGNKTVNWLVSDTSIATIDASGFITGVAPGAVVVRASADDNPAIYREITVTITKKPVTGISAITAPSNVTTIEYNNTLTLSANVLPLNATNKELRWSSSNSGIVEVTNTTTGTIRGKTISGTPVIITATTVEGNFKAMYTIYCVEIAVQGMDEITTASGSSIINIGDTDTLITQVLPLDAKVRAYAWSYNAATQSALTLMQSIVSLNQNTGVITALSTGYALIKATSGARTNAGQYITKTITIQVGEPVESLTPITYGATTVLTQSQVVQLGTTIVPTTASQTGIYWSSSAPATATISQTGVLTVLANPRTKAFTITATPTPYNLDATGNVISVSQSFTISIPVASIGQVLPTNPTIARGASRNMSAIIQPSNADDITVSVSIDSATNQQGQSVDPSTIVTLNGNYITAIARGTFVVRVSSNGNPNIYSTRTLTVT